MTDYTQQQMLQAQADYLHRGGSAMAAMDKLKPYEFQPYPKWVRLPDGRELGIAQDEAEEAAMLAAHAPPEPAQVRPAPAVPAPVVPSAQAELTSAVVNAESGHTVRGALIREFKALGIPGKPHVLSIDRLRKAIARFKREQAAAAKAGAETTPEFPGLRTAPGSEADG